MVALDFGEVEARARSVRERLGLGHSPVPDITTALSDAGIVVLVRPLGDDGPDGLYIRRPSFAAILLNGDAYLPRLRFTAAHELGHHEYGARAVVDVVVGPSQVPEEKRANAFAASFLMPSSALEKRVDRTGPVTAEQVLELANEFGVSFETLVYRLHNLRLLRGGAPKRDSLMGARAVVLSETLRRRRLERRSVVPADYMTRAIEGYRVGRLSLDRLAELLFLDEESLGRDLGEAGILHPEDA